MEIFSWSIQNLVIQLLSDFYHFLILFKKLLLFHLKILKFLILVLLAIFQLWSQSLIFIQDIINFFAQYFQIALILLLYRFKLFFQPFNFLLQLFILIWFFLQHFYECGFFILIHQKASQTWKVFRELCDHSFPFFGYWSTWIEGTTGPYATYGWLFV